MSIPSHMDDFHKELKESMLKHIRQFKKLRVLGRNWRWHLYVIKKMDKIDVQLLGELSVLLNGIYYKHPDKFDELKAQLEKLHRDLTHFKQQIAASRTVSKSLTDILVALHNNTEGILQATEPLVNKELESESIKKPPGFFDKKYLWYLDTKYNGERKKAKWGFPKPLRVRISEGTRNASSSQTITRVVSTLKDFGFNPRTIKTLDLGSGNGFVMAAFSVYNCPIYGIERNKVLVNYALKHLPLLPMKQKPMIHLGSYYDPRILKKGFADGTRMGDIDFFYCYTYSKAHAQKVLTHTLAKWGMMKNGAIAYLPQLGLSDAMLSRFGFRPLEETSQYKRASWIQKVTSVRISNGLLDSYDYERKNH